MISAKIESADLSLETVFKDYYSVPDFQREYVWQPEHVEKLLEDIYDEFYEENGKFAEGLEYFVGSIVACRDGSTGTYQLIDGQQRLTTIYLVFVAIRDFLHAHQRQIPQSLNKLIADLQMDPSTGDDVFHYRIDLQYEDSAGVLQKIAADGTATADIKPTTASVANILNAYQTIRREFLDVNFGEQPDKVKQFLAAFVNRVKLIRILTPNLSHALKVFETINDRGVGLNAMDLLKNLLFMRTPSPQYAKLKAHWKTLVDTLDDCREKPLRFLRYFVMANFETDISRPLREDEIYDWLVRHAARISIDDDPIGFATRLVESAKAYASFLKGKNRDDSANRYLANIALLGGTVRQHFILLLAGQHLPADAFTQLCRHLENLFFCYIITREPTKNFERNFARWSRQLRSCQSLDDVNQFIEQYIAPDLHSRSKNFDFAFAELRASRIQQYRMRYILAKLTQYVDEAAWNQPHYSELSRYFANTIDVEHILPRNPSAPKVDIFDKPEEYDDFVDRLGNLTLLEKTINTSISNGPFGQKIHGYRQSQFLLTKSLAEKPTVGVNTALNRAVENLPQFDQWDSKDIEQRQAVLTELARKVWNMDSAGLVVQSAEVSD